MKAKAGTKAEKPKAGKNGQANGDVEQQAEPLSVVERGRRHLERPHVGVGQWKCRGAECGHEWSGHSRVRVCPKCGSRDIARHDPSLDWLVDLVPVLSETQFAAAVDRVRGADAGTAAKFWLGSEIGGPWWLCAECAFSFRAAGVPQCCCRPECGSKNVGPRVLPDEFARARNPFGHTTGALDVVDAAVRRTMDEQAGMVAQTELKSPARFELVEREKIEASPDNPRKHFDQEKLAELATTIKAHGILEPLLLRELDDGRLIVAGGERRLRAAEIAGLGLVPAMIRRMTDREFAEVQLIENLQREDLNALEEAEAFERATTAGGYTQQQLADKLAVTQGHVANRIRLLELPDMFRKAVAAGRLPPTHARHVLPWVDCPRVMKAIAKALPEDGSRLPTVDDWSRSCLAAMRNATREMDPKAWHGPKFDLTAAIRARLDVRDVPQLWGKGQQARAFNAKLWDRLQSAAAKQSASQEAERSEKAERKRAGKAKQAKAGDARENTFGPALAEWKQEWYSAQIAARLPKLPEARLWTLLLAAASWSHSWDGWQLWELLCSGAGKRDSMKCLNSLLSVKPAGVGDLVRRLLAQLFGTDGDRQSGPSWWDDGMLPAIATAVGVTLKDWQPDFDFLDLWPDNWLEELADLHFGEEFRDRHPSRKSLIYALVESWPVGYIPRELETVDAAGKFEAEKPREKFALEKGKHTGRAKPRS